MAGQPSARWQRADVSALLLPTCLRASTIWGTFLEQLYRKWNVEWNVQIQQARRVFSSSSVQNRSVKRLFERLFSPSCLLVCLLSHQHERAVLGEKTVRVYLQCFFIVRLYRWCNILQWCPILTVLFLCYLALLCTGLCLKFFSSIISWTFYVTPAGLIWSVCLHSPFWSSCISWIFLPSPPCPQFVFLYSLHKSLSLSPPFTVYLHLSHLTLFCHLQLKQREMCLHHRRPPTTAAPRRPAWQKR